MPQSVEPSSPRRWPKLVVAAALVAGIVAIFALDLHREVSPPAIRAWLLSSGPWGPLLFVVVFAVLQPFGLSAHVFIVAASLVWPPLVATALSWVGVLAASAVSYWFARWMGRAWVQARLPERLRRWDGALETHGFRTVLVMRLVLFTFGPMQLMLGVSRVRFVPFLAATAIGVLPMVAFESFVGAGVVAWLFD